MEKSKSKYRMTWARLLKRVFRIDMSTCPKCKKSELKIISAIQTKDAINKILIHLRLNPEIPVLKPARAPPGGQQLWMPQSHSHQGKTQTQPAYDIDQTPKLKDEDISQAPKDW